MASNPKTIPDPPFISAFLDNTGFVSKPWAIWIRQAFARMGGNDAPANSEITAVITEQVTLEAAITALQSDITALQATSFGLGVGPTL